MFVVRYSRSVVHLPSDRIGIFSAWRSKEPVLATRNQGSVGRSRRSRIDRHLKVVGESERKSQESEKEPGDHHKARIKIESTASTGELAH